MILGVPIDYVLMDFFLFSFAGWIYESAFVSIRNRKLVNRGFFVGPVIPLYGFGAVSVYLLLRPFADIPSLLYVMGMIVATILEYVTSLALEKIFHTRWWDYSDEQYNFQGRIALIPSMFWGILSLFMFDFLQPAADFVIQAIPEKAGHIGLMIALVLFGMDAGYSIIAATNFRKQLENLYEFKKELENLFADIRQLSLSDLLSVNVKGKSGRSILNAYNEMKESFYEKLSSWRQEMEAKGSNSSWQTTEERLKSYWENRSRILKKNPLFGNQRLFDAFPTMKLTSKKHSAVDIKELLLNGKQSAKNSKKDK
ncbi:MAG: hypothetical protein SO170_02250 [Butyribacter sp.]|nr:hypothetical protein [bacterium]MDY3853775.1 hypothetical protein [Butyribacter sp.]